jgi:hypothetical protein
LEGIHARQRRLACSCPFERVRLGDGCVNVLSAHPVFPPYYTCLSKNVFPPSQNRWHYGIRACQTFSTLTRFVGNTCNIYISK